MTLQRVGMIDLTEGADASKPIEQLGGSLQYREFLQTIDAASAAASTASSQGLTVTGIAIGDIPLFCMPAEGLTAGVVFVPLGPALAANLLQIRVVNPTIAAVDAASVAVRIGVLRPL